LAKSSWQWFTDTTRNSQPVTRNSQLNQPIIQSTIKLAIGKNAVGNGLPTQPATRNPSLVTQSTNHSINHKVGSWQKAVGNGLPTQPATRNPSLVTRNSINQSFNQP